MAIEVSDLRDVLGLLPPESRVIPNAQGNLAILDADRRYVGYIDLSEGPDCGTAHYWKYPLTE